MFGTNSTAGREKPAGKSICEPLASPPPVSWIPLEKTGLVNARKAFLSPSSSWPTVLACRNIEGSTPKHRWDAVHYIYYWDCNWHMTMTAEAIQSHRDQDFPWFPFLSPILYLLHPCSWKWEAHRDVGNAASTQIHPHGLWDATPTRAQRLQNAGGFSSLSFVRPFTTRCNTWCMNDTRSDTAAYFPQYVENHTYNTQRNRSVEWLHAPLPFDFHFTSTYSVFKHYQSNA